MARLIDRANDHVDFVRSALEDVKEKAPEKLAMIAAYQRDLDKAIAARNRLAGA